ncbi:MAG: hypothetical protein LC797_01120 [Chloroflexi bacterium]|nr:hypothetical protein [Chloroflexota bacterium]
MAAIRIDPERLAYLEAAGWRAYYDRRWLKLIGLMVQLNQEQFHIPFPLSVVAAYHVARGSLAWVPVENDPAVVRRHFTRFYRIARRWSGMSFVPRRAAELEVGYWIEHRRLVGDPNKESFIQAMTALHSHLFGLSAERMRDSAEWRIKANNTVDLITGGLSTDVAADWAKLEQELRQCYRSIKLEIEPPQLPRDA